MASPEQLSWGMAGNPPPRLRGGKGEGIRLNPVGVGGSLDGGEGRPKGPTETPGKAKIGIRTP